jgi:hypothetical protein
MCPVGRHVRISGKMRKSFLYYTQYFRVRPLLYRNYPTHRYFHARKFRSLSCPEFPYLGDRDWMHIGGLV